MLTLGRREEGPRNLDRVRLADELGGAPPRWQAWALRSRLSYAAGDDDAAAAAAREAKDILGAWIATLTPEHAAGVRAAPEAAAVLAAG